MGSPLRPRAGPSSETATNEPCGSHVCAFGQGLSLEYWSRTGNSERKILTGRVALTDRVWAAWPLNQTSRSRKCAGMRAHFSAMPFRGLHYGDYASVMVSSLEEVNGFICDPVDQPVFLADTARPAACQHIFERLRLSQPLEWIPHHCLLKFLDAVPLPFQAWSALALLAATPIGDAVRCVASVRGVQFP
jgi:hypothetical protein